MIKNTLIIVRKFCVLTNSHRVYNGHIIKCGPGRFHKSAVFRKDSDLKKRLIDESTCVTNLDYGFVRSKRHMSKTSPKPSNVESTQNKSTSTNTQSADEVKLNPLEMKLTESVTMVKNVTEKTDTVPKTIEAISLEKDRAAATVTVKTGELLSKSLLDPKSVEETQLEGKRDSNTLSVEKLSRQSLLDSKTDKETPLETETDAAIAKAEKLSRKSLLFRIINRIKETFRGTTKEEIVKPDDLTVEVKQIIKPNEKPNKQTLSTQIPAEDTTAKLSDKLKSSHKYDYASLQYVERLQLEMKLGKPLPVVKTSTVQSKLHKESSSVSSADRNKSLNYKELSKGFAEQGIRSFDDKKPLTTPQEQINLSKKNPPKILQSLTQIKSQSSEFDHITTSAKEKLQNMKPRTNATAKFAASPQQSPEPLVTEQREEMPLIPQHRIGIAFDETLDTEKKKDEAVLKDATTELKNKDKMRVYAEPPNKLTPAECPPHLHMELFLKNSANNAATYLHLKDMYLKAKQQANEPSVVKDPASKIKSAVSISTNNNEAEKLHNVYIPRHSPVNYIATSDEKQSHPDNVKVGIIYDTKATAEENKPIGPRIIWQKPAPKQKSGRSPTLLELKEIYLKRKSVTKPTQIKDELSELDSATEMLRKAILPQQTNAKCSAVPQPEIKQKVDSSKLSPKDRSRLASDTNMKSATVQDDLNSKKKTFVSEKSHSSETLHSSNEQPKLANSGTNTLLHEIIPKQNTIVPNSYQTSAEEQSIPEDYAETSLNETAYLNQMTKVTENNFLHHNFDSKITDRQMRLIASLPIYVNNTMPRSMALKLLRLRKGLENQKMNYTQLRPLYKRKRARSCTMFVRKRSKHERKRSSGHKRKVRIARPESETRENSIITEVDTEKKPRTKYSTNEMNALSFYENDVTQLRSIFEKGFLFTIPDRPFEPWTPIPSWPIPQKYKRPPLQCPKDGCPTPPPPKDGSFCKPREKPCTGFPKRDFFSNLLFHNLGI